MVVSSFYNAYFGINTNCYELCNAYSIEGIVKQGSNHEIAKESVV